MEYAEVTIKQVADECGVSKSTAVRKLKELNLPVITRGGKGTVFLGPEAASALAHALIKRRTPDLAPSDEVSSILGMPYARGIEAIDSTMIDSTEPYDAEDNASELDLVLEAYEERINTLKQLNDALSAQIVQLNQTIELLKSNHEATLAVLTNQIDLLNEQVVALQREKDRLRDELTLSRALEGFHFPWQRDRIMARYLLPASSPTPSHARDDEFEIAD